MNPTVAVVILNWNGEHFLEKFLPSVVKYSSACSTIVVADNGSTDRSVGFLQENYPEVRIVRNESNGGFAKGYNDALKQVEADYYVLLNSDIEVTENWIEPVINFMEADESIAACQPKLRSYHEPEKFEYAGAAGGFIDKYGYPFCRGRIFQSIETDQNQFDDPVEIFWATGACMFVRAKLYHRLGGFDDDFFAHMEEIDFCWRLKNSGYKIMYCPHSTVFHVGAGTLPKSSSRKTYLNFRNNLSLLYKNLPQRYLWRVFLLRAGLDWIAALKFLLDAGWGDLRAVLRAQGYFISHYKQLKKKRKALVQIDQTCVYKHSLVLDHYLRGKKYFSDLDPRKISK